LIDRKTGVKVRIDGRSQHQNKRKAFDILELRLSSSVQAEEAQRVSKMKAEQAGSGMRGDKVRTYREQDDTVSDHRSEKKARLKDILAGKLDKLW
jgi:peptide chain release factor 1